MATYGASYLGFVQWALAMGPPPELVAAIVHVGPHDFSRTAYRNGVFDLYNYISWSDLIAHQESTRALPALVRLATAERRLRPVLDRLPVAAGVRDLLGREPTSAERWIEHPQLSDPFWTPLQCGAALERITVPVLVVGGWHDLFIEQGGGYARSPRGKCPPGCWSGRGTTWTSRTRAPPRSSRASPGSTVTRPQQDRSPADLRRGRSARTPGTHLGGRRGRGGVARDPRLAASRRHAAALVSRHARFAQHRGAVPGCAGFQLPLRPGRPHAVAGRRHPGPEWGDPQQPRPSSGDWTCWYSAASRWTSR